MSVETNTRIEQNLDPETIAEIDKLGELAIGLSDLKSTPPPTYENGATLENPQINPGSELPKRRPASEATN